MKIQNLSKYRKVSIRGKNNFFQKYFKLLGICMNILDLCFMCDEKNSEDFWGVCLYKCILCESFNCMQIIETDSEHKRFQFLSLDRRFLVGNIGKMTTGRMKKSWFKDIQAESVWNSEMATCRECMFWDTWFQHPASFQIYGSLCPFPFNIKRSRVQDRWP